MTTALKMLTIATAAIGLSVAAAQADAHKDGLPAEKHVLIANGYHHVTSAMIVFADRNNDGFLQSKELSRLAFQNQRRALKE